jgi:hypothetical protein
MIRAQLEGFTIWDVTVLMPFGVVYLFREEESSLVRDAEGEVEDGVPSLPFVLRLSSGMLVNARGCSCRLAPFAEKGDQDQCGRAGAQAAEEQR